MHSSAHHLCNVEEEERHHEREQTSGLSEGETENGVLEELATERGVAGDTLDETTENRADTDTSTSKTDGSDTSTLDLGGGDHGGGGRLSDDAAGLDQVAAGVVLEGIAESAVLDEGVAGSCNPWVSIDSMRSQTARQSPIDAIDAIDAFRWLSDEV
jgi:hypothetical protein